MHLALFFLTLFLLKGICFALNWMSAKRSEGEKAYYSMGNGISLFPLILTLIGAVFGGGSVIGSAEEAFIYGPIFLLYPLGFCFGFILVGIGNRKRLSEIKISTVAQIFEVVYQSPALKKIASLFSITSLFFILVVQIVAAKKFFLTLGIESLLPFFLFWTLVFLYAVLGGFKAVVMSHVVQTTFFIAVLFFSLFYILLHHPTPVLDLPSFYQPAEPSKALSWLLMPIFFFLTSQDIAQRCFAAKTPQIAVQGCILAGILALIVMSAPIALGVMANHLQIAPKQGASILITLTSLQTNPFLAALLGSALIAAVTSSAESLINATSSNIYLDFNLGRYLKGFWAKGISLGVSFFSLAIAQVFNNIIDIVIFSYELSICTMFIPVSISFFKKRGNAISAYYSVLAGALSFMYFRFLFTPVGYQLLSLSLSLLAYSIGELQVYLAKKKRDEAI